MHTLQRVRLGLKNPLTINDVTKINVEQLVLTPAMPNLLVVKQQR